MLINGSTLTFKPQAPSAQPEDYSIFGLPEKLRREYLANWRREHPEPAPGQFKIEEEDEVYTPPPHYNDMVDHEANFFQAVRTRQPVVENEVFGNNAALGCHMSNYSYFNKTAAVWDASAKRIIS
jgi:hypothetical protein